MLIQTIMLDHDPSLNAGLQGTSLIVYGLLAICVVWPAVCETVSTPPIDSERPVAAAATKSESASSTPKTFGRIRKLIRSGKPRLPSIGGSSATSLAGYSTQRTYKLWLTACSNSNSETRRHRCWKNSSRDFPRSPIPLASSWPRSVANFRTVRSPRCSCSTKWASKICHRRSKLTSQRFAKKSNGCSTRSPSNTRARFVESARPSRSFVLPSRLATQAVTVAGTILLEESCQSFV